MLVSHVPDGGYDILAKRAIPDEFQIVLDADHRPGIAGKDDHIDSLQYAVDTATRQSKFTKM
jgi:hypothetical protein